MLSPRLFLFVGEDTVVVITAASFKVLESSIKTYFTGPHSLMGNLKSEGENDLILFCHDQWE